MNSLWLLSALVIFAASFMQGAAGFAFALLAVPFLVWAGYPLAEASLLTALNALLIVSLATFRFRKVMDWKLLLPTIPLRLVTIALGICLLHWLNGLERGHIRQLLGGILLLVIVLQVFVRPKPRKQLATIWWWLAFGLAGLFMGMVGFGGPPSVLWVMAHDWPNQKSRAFLTGLYWTGLPIQIALLLLTFNQRLYSSLPLALSFIPVAVLGVYLGLFWGDKLNKAHLRGAAYLLLSFAALSSLIQP